MTLTDLRNQIPDFAKDLKLNFSTVLTEQGAPGLSQDQIHGIALACAIAAGNKPFADSLKAAIGDELDPARRNAAATAAALMSMNNVYYRFVHLASNEEYSRMPARLRMNAIANPGIDKVEFELYCLAVSAINGCGLCVDSHEKTLKKAEVSSEAVHSAVRIGSVIHAVARVLDYGDLAA